MPSTINFITQPKSIMQFPRDQAQVQSILNIGTQPPYTIFAQILIFIPIMPFYMWQKGNKCFQMLEMSWADFTIR